MSQPLPFPSQGPSTAPVPASAAGQGELAVRTGAGAGTALAAVAGASTCGGSGAGTAGARDAVAEADLLARLGAGDSAVLNEIWENWSRPLFAVAVRALGNAEDAEEVLQDTLVRIWSRASKFDAALCRPFSWAVMILRGLIHDRLRARRRQPVLVAQSAGEGRVEKAAVHFMPGLRGDLEQAMSLLTVEERHTLEAAIFHPSTHEELAARLGQPLGTVKTRIRRAFEKLRAALHAELPT